MMDRVIKSFTVDHTKLKPGLYVSRVDAVGGSSVTTYDLRMREPNVDTPVTPSAMHTLEHLLATYLRTVSPLGPYVVYVGPMGCLTGMYLILKDGPSPSPDVRGAVTAAMDWVSSYDGPVPGASPEMCGNHSFQDLPAARDCARAYADSLRTDFRCEYTYLDHGEGV